MKRVLCFLVCAAVVPLTGNAQAIAKDGMTADAAVAPAIVDATGKRSVESPALQKTSGPRSDSMPQASESIVEKKAANSNRPDTITGVYEIVVSANRWAQNKKEVPNRVIRLTEKDIALANPQTSADLLGSSGEVFIQKSQLGGGSPMLRGFTANSVLLVVDGVRMNNAIYRAGNLQNVISIDANAIDYAEILFGPGSIMYGSDALGGVFSFTSKSPKLSPDGQLICSGNAVARYSSANVEKTGHLGLSLGLKNFGSYTALTVSGFDDSRMGKNGDYYDFYKRPDFIERIDGKDSVVTNEKPEVQAPSGYGQINVLENLVFRVSNALRVKNSLYYSTTSDYPRYDRLILKKDPVAYKSAEWYYGPQKWLMNALSLRYTGQNGAFDEMNAIAAFQDYTESRHDRNYGARWLYSRTEHVYGYSANVDFTKNLPLSSRLMYGMEALWNDVRSSAGRKDTNGAVDDIAIVDTRYPDGYNDYGSGAAYGHLTTDWNKKITTTLGMRYSYVHLKSLIDENRTFYPFLPGIIEIDAGAATGAIGLAYKPSDNLQFDLSGSSGYRAPNIDDIGKIFAYTAGTVRMPNEGLKPEYAYNLELGTEAKVMPGVEVEGAAFYTYVKDLMAVGDFSYNGLDSIDYNGSLNKITAIVNKSKAYLWGGSASLRLDFTKNITFKNSISYTAGIEGNDTVPLRPAPPLFGASHLLYKTNTFKADFYVLYNATKREGKNPDAMPINDENRDYLYPLEDPLNPQSHLCPAWYTINLKLSYQISREFRIDAGVENLMDKNYRPYGSGISAPGINFISALRVSL